MYSIFFCTERLFLPNLESSIADLKILDFFVKLLQAVDNWEAEVLQPSIFPLCKQLLYFIDTLSMLVIVSSRLVSTASAAQSDISHAGLKQPRMLPLHVYFVIVYLVPIISDPIFAC